MLLTVDGDVHPGLELLVGGVHGGAAVVACVLLRQLLDEERRGRVAGLLLGVDSAEQSIVRMRTIYRETPHLLYNINQSQH